MAASREVPGHIYPPDTIKQHDTAFKALNSYNLLTMVDFVAWLQRMQRECPEDQDVPGFLRTFSEVVPTVLVPCLLGVNLYTHQAILDLRPLNNPESIPTD